MDTSIDLFDDGHHHRRRRFAFCAWACILIFIIIVIFLFAGISYLAFLQSGMPEVLVRSFDITNLQVDPSQNKMDASISLCIRVSNKNEKLILLYGPLSVFVSSEDVTLGKDQVKGFIQKPQNYTDLAMKMKVEDGEANSYAAEELKSDMRANEVVFDVYMSGKIGIKMGSLEMINVPFLSSCHEIKKMDVDFGLRPKCDVKMFGSRPSNN